MTDDNDTPRDGDYQYRAVFVLGGDWRARSWKDRIGAIEDIGVAAEKGAPATAIERKDTETGQIQRAPTPEEEWKPEEETDLKIRVGDEDQQELVTDGGEQIQTVSADWATAGCPNCEEPAQEPVEFLPREIECEACGQIWRMVQ